jgi:hypothetical protein
VLDGADLRVTLHVRLSGEDEDLQRLRVERGGEEKSRDYCDGDFHELSCE